MGRKWRERAGYCQLVFCIVSTSRIVLEGLLTLYCKPFMLRSSSRPAKRALPMLVLDNRQHLCTVVSLKIEVAVAGDSMPTRRTDRGRKVGIVALRTG
jgi:hypothetical protein